MDKYNFVIFLLRGDKSRADVVEIDKCFSLLAFTKIIDEQYEDTQTEVDDMLPAETWEEAKFVANGWNEACEVNGILLDPMEAICTDEEWAEHLERLDMLKKMFQPRRGGD